MSLSVSLLEAHDIESIVRYFYDASKEDLDRMAVDASRFPPEDEMRASLFKTARIPPGQGDACYLVWKVDDIAIGFSSLKDIVREVRGGMHLHMWNSSSRGRGFGAKLFCMSVLKFYDLYPGIQILCEPCSTNPMPNKMLCKIGFPLLKTYQGRSSALSAETELNCYDIQRKIAVAYLETIAS